MSNSNRHADRLALQDAANAVNYMKLVLGRNPASRPLREGLVEVLRVAASCADRTGDAATRKFYLDRVEDQERILDTIAYLDR